jgi:hypothetical protein
MVKEGGFRSLWRSNLTDISRLVPEASFKLLTNEWIKPIISQNPKKQTFVEQVACGAIAGAASATVCYPLNIARSRLAVAPSATYRGLFHCLRSIYVNEGFKNIYSGLNPTMMSKVPYTAVEIATYQKLRDMYCANYHKNPTRPVLFTVGLMSGMLGKIVAYPL